MRYSKCKVYNCSNNSKNIKNIDGKFRFHSFPKNDPGLLKAWISFCKRKDEFNVKTSRICSVHFLREDYINYLQFEMGLCENLLLKKGAKPSLYKNAEADVSSIRSKKRMDAETQEEIVNPLLEEPCEAAKIIHLEIFAHDSIDVDNNDFDDENDNFVLQDEFDVLKTKMKNMECENGRLQEVIDKQKNEIAALKSEVKKSEFQRLNIENKLQEIFTPGQVKKLKIGSKRLIWSEDDLAESITLYSTSPNAYKLLKSKQFPLPSIRTLNSWARNKKLKE